MSLDVMPTAAALLGPETFIGLTAFTKGIMDGERPLCLTCDYEWTDLHCPPPAGFAVVRTHDLAFARSKDAVAITSGICRNCCEHERLMERCLDAYRKIWPDLRSVNVQPTRVGLQ